MDPNSSVHGQSWQDQELTKTNKQKSSIQISTAATDSGILMQNSLSHLSKVFREMPSYTKLTYFMIHGGPRVWVFSALHYCCYLGNQASTSLPSSMESKDAAHTNYLSTKPVFDTECSLIFPAALLYSSYSHNKTYWVVAKDQDTPGSGTRKKSRVTFPKEKVRSPMGSTENSYEMLHTRLKYKLQSLICTARVRSREALRWTVSPPPRWSLTTQNTWS